MLMYTGNWNFKVINLCFLHFLIWRPIKWLWMFEYICVFQNVSVTTSIKGQSTGRGVNVAGPSVFVTVFTHASKELGRVTVLPVLLCCDITQSGLSHLPGLITGSCALADKRKCFLSTCFIVTLICTYRHSQFAVVSSLYSQQPKALRCPSITVFFFFIVIILASCQEQDDQLLACGWP
jgi:hypothetical protein